MVMIILITIIIDSSYQEQRKREKRSPKILTEIKQIPQPPNTALPLSESSRKIVT